MEEGKGGWEQDGRAQQQPTVVDRGCGRCGARTMLVGRRRARRRSQAGRSCTLSAAGVVSPLPLRRDSRASEGSPRPRGDRREQRGCHMPKRTPPPQERDAIIRQIPWARQCTNATAGPRHVSVLARKGKGGVPLAIAELRWGVHQQGGGRGPCRGGLGVQHRARPPRRRLRPAEREADGGEIELSLEQGGGACRMSLRPAVISVAWPTDDTQAFSGSPCVRRSTIVLTMCF